jgi:hypothetical protein
MRIWSLHPRYLDAKGLVGLWRETLLARAVLLGNTRGYTNHSQLRRFKYEEAPIKLIDSYLCEVREEGLARGYKLDPAKIGSERYTGAKLQVSEGQLRYEWAHLRAKLLVRCPEWCERAGEVDLPEPHPLFFVVPGPVEGWERVDRDKT